MEEEKLKFGPYLTIYKKDYIKKKISTQIQKTHEQEFQDPVAEGFKNYLKLKKTDKIEPPYEACEDYLPKIVKERPKIGQIYFKEPVDAVTIEGQQLLKGKSLYQVDYCDIEADIKLKLKEMQKKKFNLPEDWQIPLTTQRYDFREPTILSEHAMDKPIIVKHHDNLGQNEKLNEILNVQTGDSEYNEVIGKLGAFIVEEEMHGKIVHPEVKQLWLRLRQFEKYIK